MKQIFLGSLYPRGPQKSLEISDIEAEMDDYGLDNHELQILFDTHARAHAGTVWVEDFQENVNAHGLDNIIDEYGFQNLLANNTQYVFIECVDANNDKYWIDERQV